MTDFKLRRSMLYVPGNMPSMLQNIPLFKCDSIIIDLEDGVNYAEKDAARILVTNFLQNYRKRSQEVLVRINPLYTKWGYDDLKMILPAGPDGIRFPMAETPELVRELDEALTKYEKQAGLEVGHFSILPSIETIKSVLNAYEIAKSSKRLTGLAFGAEDFTASMGIQRTRTGEELFHARMVVVWAAKAAGIQAIDTVFSDANDMEALLHETEMARKLGYTGKSMVNPRQIDVIHQAFAPKQEEIDHALKVVEAIKQARLMGTGVISLGGKMVDAPVVKRAVTTLQIAYAQGLINEQINEEVIYGKE
ncbi:MAG: CoA ester lyase [Opitutaceae bacterium]|nr:CoA ester lyase [Opitutaceae bacterium]